MATFIPYIPSQTAPAAKKPSIKLALMERVIEFQTLPEGSKDHPITLSDELPAAITPTRNGRTDTTSLSHDPDSPSAENVVSKESINQHVPASAGHVHDVFAEFDELFGKGEKKRSENLAHEDAGADVGENSSVGSSTEVASDDLYAAYSMPGELDGANDEPTATNNAGGRQEVKRNRELRRLHMDLIPTPLTKTRKEIRRAKEKEKKAAFASLQPRKRRCSTYAYPVNRERHSGRFHWGKWNRMFSGVETVTSGDG